MAKRNNRSRYIAQQNNQMIEETSQDSDLLEIETTDEEIVDSENEIHAENEIELEADSLVNVEAEELELDSDPEVNEDFEATEEEAEASQVMEEPEQVNQLEVEAPVEDLNLDESSAEESVPDEIDAELVLVSPIKRFEFLKRPNKRASQEPKREADLVQAVEEHRSPEEIKAELTKLSLRMEKLGNQVADARRDLNQAEEAALDFAEFVSSTEASLSWRLKSKFTENLGLVDRDIKTVVSVAESLDVNDLGLLVRLKQEFLRRFWLSILVAAIVVAIFFALRYFLAENTADLARFIVDYPPNQFIIQVISAWFSYFVGTIIWYYRSWSTYGRSLQLAEVKLIWIRDSLKIAQDSKSKLTKLYAHAEQWMQLIALSLFHPWQIDPKWESSTGSIISDEKLPNSVSVAQAIEGSLGAMAALETTAVARLIRPGWREQVFMRQIAAVAKSHGIQPGKLDYEVLDKDSPSVPNGTRAFFVEKFRDEAVQVSVARSYLSELNNEVQTVGLLESKPPVKNDYFDKLSVIAEDLDILGEVKEEKSWDGFLLEIVGEHGDPIIPVSPFSFTDTAITDNSHGNPRVSIQMPARLRTLIGDFDGSRIVINSYEDKARLPLDLVVRVDSVGPLEPESLKLWNRIAEKAQADAPTQGQSNSIATSACRNCGRKDCPSTVPGSNGICSYSGV